MVGMNKKLLHEDIILENQLVKLIPFESSRLSELNKIFFEDAIWRYMGANISNENDLDQYITDTILRKNQGMSYPFLIIDCKTDRVAGSTRFGYINKASEKTEIGWTWLGLEFQGTGLNKTCKFELLKFGFESIGFRRIQFSADEENIRSQKAIAKLGATQEGIFRNNYIDVKGNS